MSLDVMLFDKYGDQKYSGNITHNLNEMAIAVSEEFYKALWRPEEINCKKAKDLVDILFHGYKELVQNPKEYDKYNSPNGWGRREDLVVFVAEYLAACLKYSDCEIQVCR